MEHTFLFEEALFDNGINQNQLPANIQSNLSKLTALCKALHNTPDENMDELEMLNEKIDNLDEKIADNINAIPKKTVDAPVDAPANAPADTSEQNSGGLFVALAVLGGIIWVGLKFFSGKQQK